MRAAFFGTPELSVPALKALTEVAEVVGVICQPDRPSGRGLALRPPAVKREALALGLSVHQPLKVKTGDLDQWLLERNVELVLVLAYGRILPPKVLASPRYGCLNLHASLLPKYRGAAPIQWALMNGETETGISLMHMTEGLDEGPVYLERAIAIQADETAGELSSRLAELAAEVTRRDVPEVVTGRLAATPQDETRVSWAPPLGPSDAELCFDQTARSLVNQIRGLSPRPGAFTTLHGKRLRVLRARVFAASQQGPPGQVHVFGSHLVVSANEGSFEIVEAQLEGKRALPARDLINGRALRELDVLGVPSGLAGVKD